MVQQPQPPSQMKKLMKKIAEGRPSAASDAAWEAARLLLLAGHAEATLHIFEMLLTGPLMLAQASTHRHPLGYIALAVCHALGRTGLDGQPTEAAVVEREAQVRGMMLRDKTSQLPLDPGSEEGVIEGIQAHVRARGLSHDPSAMTLEQLHALNFHRRAQRLAAGGDLAAALHELAPLIDGHAKLRASYALTETLILATDLAFRLGEEATARRHLASAYAHDPSNLTVNTLFSLRPSARAIVNGALANQLGISDDDTSRLLEALDRRVDAGAPVATKPRLDWKGLLRRLGARPRAGASPSALAGLEQRLAVTLPDSYRAFLAASDGAPAIQRGSPHLLRASEVRWFAEENQGWIDVWTAGRDSPSDQEYLVYGTGQDPTNLRAEYLKTALQISSVEEGSVFLLNPKIRTDDGEWEAWYFDVKLPGAQRYTSFRELMEALRREQ